MVSPVRHTPSDLAPQPGAQRWQALVGWNADLSTLENACHAFMGSSSALLKHCPLNTSDSLEHQDTDSTISVAEAFRRISAHMPQLALMEEQLKMARIALVSRRNHMSKISHVSRLPVEILTQVFQYACEEQEPPHGSDTEYLRQWEASTLSARKHEMPIVFTWVCKHWRDVALNSPLLWTRITFREGLPFYKTQRKLVRSQEAPLSLAFDTSFMPPDSFLNVPTYTSVALAAALPAFSRWRHLKITSSTPGTIRHAFNTFQPRSLQDKSLIPKLESLELNACTTEADNIVIRNTTTLVEFFNLITAELSRLSVKGVRLPSWSSNAFRNLRHLTIGGTQNMAPTQQPSTGELRSILLGCAELETLNLESFALQDVGEQFTPPQGSAFWIHGTVGDDEASNVLDFLPPQGPVPLPHLHSLELRNVQTRTLGLVLMFLEAPNLRSFLLDTSKEPTELTVTARVVTAALTKFLSTTNPGARAGALIPLERLYLSDKAHILHTQALMLQSTSENLRELTLTHELKVDEAFLNPLLKRFRRLESLRIMRADRLDCQALAHLLRKRDHAAQEMIHGAEDEHSMSKDFVHAFPGLISAMDVERSASSSSLNTQTSTPAPPPSRIRRLHVTGSKVDSKGHMILQGLDDVVDDLVVEGNYTPGQ